MRLKGFISLALAGVLAFSGITNASAFAKESDGDTSENGYTVEEGIDDEGMAENIAGIVVSPDMDLTSIDYNYIEENLSETDIMTGDAGQNQNVVNDNEAADSEEETKDDKDKSDDENSDKDEDNKSDDTTDVEEPDDGRPIVSILGDSVSTYYDPDIRYTPYTHRANSYYAEDIMSVNETWWYRLIEDNDWKLGVNESIGGTRVTYTKGFSVGAYRDSEIDMGKDVNNYMASDARIESLGENGTPDYIFIFGGLNDILGQANVIGEYKDIKEGKVDTFVSAYNTMLTKIEDKYPEAEIICIIPYDTAFSYIGPDYKKIADNTALVEEDIKAICKEKKITYVNVRSSLNLQFATDFIISDQAHPNANGMKIIADYIEEVMEQRSGFYEDGDVTRFYDESGNRLRNDFLKDGKKTYYFNNDAEMVTDEILSIDGKLYYFGINGAQATNRGIITYKDDSYYVSKDGTLAVDYLVDIDKNTYYFDNDGKMVKNSWIDHANERYWLDKDGHVVKDKFLEQKGAKYYLSKDGSLVRNDRIDTKAGDTYFAKADGKLRFNEFYCDGVYTYYLQFDCTAMKDRLTYHPDGKHVIYFDEDGHEVFSDFSHVKKSISGDKVDDYCFFDVFGYMYVDVITYDKKGKKLYYANPYGVLEVDKWFQFSDTVEWADGTKAEGIAGGYGCANKDGTLMINTETYDWNGKKCYMQGNGVALYDYEQ